MGVMQMRKPMLPNRYAVRWLIVVAVVLVGVLVGQSVSAKEIEPVIAPIPDVGERALQQEDLPDLIPVTDGGGEIIGYAHPEDAFVELYDPDLEFVALPVYEKDGVTLIGHDIPGKGFVPGTTPIETSRRATVPAPLEPGVSPIGEPVGVPAE